MSAELHIGTAGWNYPDWKGMFYPSSRQQVVESLTYHANFFDAVEVNSSFYRPPQAKHAERWVQLVEKNRDFIFTAKLWRRFTHDRDETPSPGEARAFLDGLAPLDQAGRLGGLLAQFPWSFRNNEENRAWLQRLFELFATVPLVLEVRHRSWNRPEIFDWLRRAKVAFCNIDQPLHDQALAPDDRCTAAVGYIRLHGRNRENWFKEGAGRDARYDYLYSEQELIPWIEKIEKMRERVRKLYVITNNHYRGQAAVNGLQIAHLSRGEKVRVPLALMKAYPGLAKISDRPAPGNQEKLPGF